MKKFLALTLAILMLVALLAGCGGQQEEAAPPAQNGSAEPSGGEEAGGGEEAFTRFEDMETVEVYMMAWGQWDGFEQVAEEINKITEEKLNVHCNLHQIFIAQYANEMGMMLAAQETIDLCMIGAGGASSFSSMSSQNMLTPLNEYLPVYAPELYGMMQKYLPANTVDGNMLAVPALRMYNTSEWLFMRTDILEHLGLTEEAMAIDSWSDFEALLQKVYEAEDSLPAELQTNCILGQQNGSGGVIAYNGLDYVSDDFAGNKAYDYLGLMYLAVDPETNEVMPWIISDETKALFDRMYDYYNAGYIYKDAATSTDYSDNMMAAGMCFAYFCNGEYGAAENKSSTTGRNLTGFVAVPIGITTSYVNSWGWGIPSTAESPEAAAALLNLMYTDPEIENLLVWGIRGRDYELNEEGEAYFLDGAQYQGLEFFYGNQFNAYPSVGQGGDFRQRQWEDNESAPLSPYFGLTVDSTAITNELTAVQAVIDKYYPTLGCGAVKADTVWEQFKQELYDAGLQAVIDHYQAAVDAFVG